MLGIAYTSALVIEDRSQKVVRERLQLNRMDWVGVDADGMLITLAGTAPNEAARFRALNLVGSVIDSSRIIDQLEVTPTTALSAPRFSVEMLRNDDGIQLIGLMPEEADSDGMAIKEFFEAASALTPDDAVPANMLQSANWPAPENWDLSLRFGLDALGLLKRSKISVSAGEVTITAIADSAADKRRYEEELGRRKPREVEMKVSISAPRPVITPFTLRFIMDANGARFDACSADTDRARDRIISAANRAGLSGTANCTVGMGAPTPRWAEGAVASINAVAAMGAGVVTFSDADITLQAGDGVSQEAYDSAIGDLRAALPDVFSLAATPPKLDAAAQGPAEFTAKLLESGRVELRGRLVDDAQQAAVRAFARASFGSPNIHLATRLDPELPDGWPIRVLAGLDSLSLLEEGTLLVRSDLVEVTGVTGSQAARAKITQILSSRLGQGQRFRVNVTYDEKRDPLAALPTPEECAASVNAVMAKNKITFTPGSAEIAAEAAPVVTQLAEVLTTCPGIALEIAGHTDSQGSETGNQALSQARAEAVLMALQGRRIDISNMAAVGYGESNPIDDNGTEAGREANRRIEFTLKPQPKAEADAAEPAASVDETTAEGEQAADPAAELTDDSLPDDLDNLSEEVLGSVEDAEDMPLDAPSAGEATPEAEAADSTATTPPAASASTETESAPEPTLTPPDAAPATEGALPTQATPEASEAAPSPSPAAPAGEATAGETPAAEAATDTTAAEGEAEDEAPDFSEDTSPSNAPTEKTVRPRTRPATQN